MILKWGPLWQQQGSQHGGCLLVPIQDNRCSSFCETF